MTEPLQQRLEQAWHAYQASLDTGDLERIDAAYAAYEQVERDMEQALRTHGDRVVAEVVAQLNEQE